jgi:hypothetical protein
MNNSVSPLAYNWQLINQEAYQDASRTVQFSNNRSTTLTNGNQAYLRITVKNTGNITWSNSGNNPVRLGTWNARDHSSIVCDTTWISCNRAATLKEASVAPGQTGTFEFSVKAPIYRGTHLDFYNVVMEGKSWFNSQDLFHTVIVN